MPVSTDEEMFVSPSVDDDGELSTVDSSLPHPQTLPTNIIEQRSRLKIFLFINIFPLLIIVLSISIILLQYHINLLSYYTKYLCNYSVPNSNCPRKRENKASKAVIPILAAVEVSDFSVRKSFAPCSERKVPMTLFFILTIRRSRSA